MMRVCTLELFTCHSTLQQGNASSRLQHAATHCSTLQHTSTQCSALQHSKILCNTLHHTLQHRATCCSTLQHTATFCNMLQHTATHRNTLQPLSGTPTSWHMCVAWSGYQIMFPNSWEGICRLARGIFTKRQGKKESRSRGVEVEEACHTYE